MITNNICFAIEEGETAYIASLYETTGKILRNLGFLEEAN